MSREWDRFALKCQSCGNEGELAIWSDDWNRWGAEWQGFKGKVYITGPVADLLHCEECGGADPIIKRRTK